MRRRREQQTVDDTLLRFEQSRGTMPDDEKLGTEWATDEPPRPDPGVVGKVRWAYARIRARVKVAL